jgi:hypothetical protein
MLGLPSLACSSSGHTSSTSVPASFQQLQWTDWRAQAEVLRALEDDRFGWNNVFARLSPR